MWASIVERPLLLTEGSIMLLLLVLYSSPPNKEPTGRHARETGLATRSSTALLEELHREYNVVATTTTGGGTLRLAGGLRFLGGAFVVSACCMFDAADFLLYGQSGGRRAGEESVAQTCGRFALSTMITTCCLLWARSEVLIGEMTILRGFIFKRCGKKQRLLGLSKSCEPVKNKGG